MRSLGWALNPRNSCPSGERSEDTDPDRGKTAFEKPKRQASRGISYVDTCTVDFPSSELCKASTLSRAGGCRGFVRALCRLIPHHGGRTDQNSISSRSHHMEMLHKIKQCHIWYLVEITINREDFLAGKHGDAAPDGRAGGYRKESRLQTLRYAATGKCGPSVNSRVTSSRPGL